MGAAEDVVGAELLVTCAVAVEVVGERLGQREVLHHAVGAVLPLQFL